jgi:hypothetical protein
MPLRVLRYLDLVVLAVAFPVFLAADLPLLGWGAVTAVWVVQRALQAAVNQRAERSDRPGTVAGLLTGSMIARGWLVAGTIFAVGVSEREAGLSGAILAITVFTVYFMSHMLIRLLEEQR